MAFAKRVNLRCVKSDKTILIIGMGPGIAFAVANLFARQGFGVGMMARRAEKLKEHEDFFIANNFEAGGFTTDIGNEQHFQSTLKSYLDLHGAPDVMLYNASSFTAGTPLKFSYDRLVDDFKVNVGGAMLAAQAMIPAMMTRGFGKCFFTGGGSAHRPFLEGFSLSIGKAGMRNFVLMLAEECKHSSVHVGMLTVHGAVRRGTRFDPELIAEKYWDMYLQLPTERVTEIDMT